MAHDDPHVVKFDFVPSDVVPSIVAQQVIGIWLLQNYNCKFRINMDFSDEKGSRPPL